MDLLPIELPLFHLIEKETGDVIGGCGYHNWQAIHYRAEIGYVLNRESDKGKDFMKEALAPIIRYGFEEMNLHRIEAFVGPNNIPSLKLIRGFGFTEEGRLREHYFINNRLEDSIVFSLLKREFVKNYNF